MLKMYTIEELVQIVNNQLSQDKDLIVTDGRISSEITVRKVRDMLTKGMLSTPVKDGRNNYFDNSHVEQIINIKKMQKEGVPEKLMKSLTEYQVDEPSIETNSMQIEASSVLNSIIGRGLNASASVMAQQSLPKTNSTPLITGALESSQRYRESYSAGMKVINEYPLDNSGKIHLKIELGYTPQDKQELLEKFKQILGI
jgi:DNA-binding transcriptional MerR regulator